MWLQYDKPLSIIMPEDASNGKKQNSSFPEFIILNYNLVSEIGKRSGNNISEHD